mmetsp:Transcript_31508/g.30074  ORF Transcript_31508/g.30074 Transcript_31508/m.30074 type:complete len:154 (-) Transcript_31508:554-1015(-)
MFKAHPMLNWHETKKIIDDGLLEQLGRSAEQHEKYVCFCEQLKCEWNSVTDYIKVSKLGFEKIILSNEKFAANKSSVNKVVLVVNDFSYNFEPGISHYILWKIGGILERNEIAEMAVKLLHDENALDFATYVNPPHLKSILDLDHAHILLKSH